MKASRREFLGGGLAAITVGLLQRHGYAKPPTPPTSPTCDATGARPLWSTRAFTQIPSNPDSVVIDGLPFADGFLGDGFDHDAIPFHSPQNNFPGGLPPAPSEEVDVAVVGGGISGLTTAYLLRRHRPVLFELHPVFGGASQGEIWDGTYYSRGGAYIITPDAGSFLQRFYKQLGLHRVKRVDPGGEDPIELNGAIVEDFWSGLISPGDAPAFQRYREVVTLMAEVDYPEIPLPEGADNQWILDLDRKTLKEDMEEQMGMPIPPLLAGAIQAYCYSSFGAGWQEISAASGWNFLAAEEFGRWVFPGGNAWMVHALWTKLARQQRRGGPHAHPRCMLRGGCRVVDVRLAPGDRAQVTWLDSEGVFRSLLARRVVMACGKHICTHVLHDLRTLDQPKYDAMHQIESRAYVVANVLLDAPIQSDFYDVFLMEDGNFPMSDSQADAQTRVIDMLNGHFARRVDVPRSVLTLYWPLAFAAGRVRLIADGSFDTFARALAPLVRRMLGILGASESAVRQVRLVRWGHALPVAKPRLIAEGVTDHLRRPFGGCVYFVNQDNWALPAVENSVLDARQFAAEIHAAL